MDNIKVSTSKYDGGKWVEEDDTLEQLRCVKLSIHLYRRE